MSRKNRKGSKFLSAMGTGQEIWMSVVNAVLAEDEENADECLRALKDDSDRKKAIAKIIVGRASKPEPTVKFETVTVPDLPAKALVAVVDEDVGLTYRDDAYAGWNFIRDERGRTYEVATWAPGHGVSSETVREHFATLGGSRPFVGNTAAFLQWIRTDRGNGWFVSIPEDGGLFRGALGNLGAPYFSRGGALRRLFLNRVAGGWNADFVFVAFRECLT